MVGPLLNRRRIRRTLKGWATRGVWGHAPPENFEILVLWNVISSVLRGQILSKMFSKSIVLFMLIFIGVTSLRSSQLYKLRGFWNCSSRKISQVSRFPAKSPDSRNKFVFLPKQPLLELSPPVISGIVAKCRLFARASFGVICVGEIVQFN